MMGVSRGDALQMPLEEYESRLWHWNEAHGGGDDEIALPDPKVERARLDRINSDSRLTH